MSHRLRLAAFPLFAAIVAFTRMDGAECIGTYSTLTLKDGRTLSAVRVVSYTNTGILVRHAGGATSIRRELLPENVTKAVHLSALRTAELNDPAFLALADKPAVIEPAAPAPAEVTVASASATAHLAVTKSAPTEAIANAAKPATIATLAAAEPPPAGEGNMPEFFAEQRDVATTAPTATSTLTGRIVVGLPGGETRLLPDVEVRVYPADLLASYLARAKQQADETAQKLLAEARAAEQDGRAADCEQLLRRARQVAQDYADSLPPAPYSTHSDAFGHFSLQHNLAETRLVARGHLRLAHGEVSYQWVGITPQSETLLTEANASMVAPAGLGSPRLALR